MKRIGLLLIGLCIGLMSMGCGPSLKEHFAQAQSYSSSVAATSKVDVWIDAEHLPGGRSRGTLGAVISTVNTVSTVASYAVGADQKARLQALIDPAILAAHVDASFDETFVARMQIPVVDSGEPTDIRIMMRIVRFGLYAESLAAPMIFYIATEVNVVHVASMTTIYEDLIVIERSASDFPRLNSIAGGIAGAAFNMTKFFGLTDEQVAEIFDMMASDAGTVLAMRLAKAIYR
ncbi:MAG: hypothetical protein FWC40_00770 [Proteobacteria bacterium]|nr:hypothetical protein [Pseudomonadota bacterium]